MGIRGIGKKLEEVTFKIAMSGCGDDGSKCQHCRNMNHLKGQGLKNTNETEEPLEQGK